jgi:hypothetical protein
MDEFRTLVDKFWSVFTSISVEEFPETNFFADIFPQARKKP